jgi:hypothetical protein
LIMNELAGFSVTTPAKAHHELLRQSFLASSS